MNILTNRIPLRGLLLTAGFLFFAKVAFSQKSIFPPVPALNQTAETARTSAANSVTVSRPGQSLNYLFTAGNWQHASNGTYTYNSVGNLTNYLRTDLTGQNSYRSITVYDNRNKIVETATDQWVSNAWNTTQGIRHLNTFDTNGNLVETIIQNRTGSSSTPNWNNDQRITVTYNAQQQQTGLIQDVWNAASNTWSPYSRYTNYTYNAAGDITSYVEEMYFGGLWEPAIKYTNLAWVKKNEELQNYTIQIYNGGLWEDDERFSKAFGTNGSWIVTTEYYANGSWQNASRRTVNFDAFGNELGERVENWLNGAWETTSHLKHLLSYNASNDVVERVLQEFNSNTQTYLNKNKWVYSSFQYFTISGAKAPQKALSVKIYPNPAQGKLYLELPENTMLTCQLSDITGKIVLSQNFHQSEAKQLNLETLMPGIYLLQLETEKGKTVRKIVKN